MQNSEVFDRISVLNDISDFTSELKVRTKSRLFDTMPSRTRSKILLIEKLCDLGIGLTKIQKAAINSCMPYLSEFRNPLTTNHFVKSVNQGIVLLTEINSVGSTFLNFGLLQIVSPEEMRDSVNIHQRIDDISASSAQFIRMNAILGKMVTRKAHNVEVVENYTKGYVQGMKMFDRICFRDVASILHKNKMQNARSNP